LSYNEARLAGMFGMNILDPIAIKEILENGASLPIIITDIKNPDKCTEVTRKISAGNGHPIKIVTGKKNCAILKIEEETVGKLLESLENETRTLLKLHPQIAPITVAILPLSKNEKLSSLSKKVYDILKSKYNTQYDDTQSIGRRYRRQDEIGTPICVTIDFESVENDNAVTIRNRDTMEQIRVNIDRIVEGIEDSITEMY